MQPRTITPFTPASLRQVLSPKSNDFFASTKITTFGTEALFIPAQGLPINNANLSSDILDLDQIRSTQRSPVLLGTIFGGIESSEITGFPPVFDHKKTLASSRLIDVYLVPSTVHWQRVAVV